MLKKQDIIVALVRKRQARYLKRNNKNGKELFKTLQQTLALVQRKTTPLGQIQ